MLLPLPPLPPCPDGSSLEKPLLRLGHWFPCELFSLWESIYVQVKITKLFSFMQLLMGPSLVSYVWGSTLR